VEGEQYRLRTEEPTGRLETEENSRVETLAGGSSETEVEMDA